MSSSDKHYQRLIDDVALPYRTNVNIVTRTQQPYYIGGLNCIIRQNAPVRRRQGFTLYGLNSTSFGTDSVQRFFTWRRWGGTFFTMACTTNANPVQSRVWSSSGSQGTFTLLFTSTSGEPFDFVVSNNFLFFANGTDAQKWDGTTLNSWGSAGPSAAPTLVNAGVGNVPGLIGHQYLFAYGVSATGYVSDVSPISAATNAASRQWTISGARSTDAQINQVHVYRTEDGGGIYYELDTSPIANPGAGTWSITDNDFDATSPSTPRLQTTQAPLKSVNLPPPAIKGLKFFSGRIWGFNNNRVYYSGYEEVTNGVPEESWGNQLTNSQAFGSEVTGIEVLGGTDTGVLLVFTADGIFYFSGSSLATFRVGIISKKRGCRNRATIISAESPVIGPFVAWLDTSSTVRMISMVAGIRDVSFDIRSDLGGSDGAPFIDQTKASITIHESGVYRWLILCDGGVGTLRVLDLERNAWMPPWSISGMTIAYSGETTLGVYTLLIGRNSKPLFMDVNSLVDEGVAYSAFVTLQLLSLLPDDKPEEVGMLEFVGVEHDRQNFGTSRQDLNDIQDVGYILDDDPTNVSAVFTSIYANKVTPFIRATVDTPTSATHVSGVNLVEEWFYLRDKMGSRRASIQITFPTYQTNFKLFSICVVSSRQGKS